MRKRFLYQSIEFYIFLKGMNVQNGAIFVVYCFENFLNYLMGLLRPLMGDEQKERKVHITCCNINTNRDRQLVQGHSATVGAHCLFMC